MSITPLDVYAHPDDEGVYDDMDPEEEAYQDELMLRYTNHTGLVGKAGIHGHGLGHGNWEEEKHPRGENGRFAHVAEHDTQAFPHLRNRTPGAETSEDFKAMRNAAHSEFRDVRVGDLLSRYHQESDKLSRVAAGIERRDHLTRTEREGYVQGIADRLAIDHRVDHHGRALEVSHDDTPPSEKSRSKTPPPKKEQPSSATSHLRGLAALSALGRAATDDEIRQAIEVSFEHRAQQIANPEKQSEDPEHAGAFAHLPLDQRVDIQLQVAEGFAWDHRASIEVRPSSNPEFHGNEAANGLADRERRIAIVRDGLDSWRKAYTTVHETMHLAEPNDLAVQMYWGSPTARGQSESRVDFAAGLVGEYFGIPSAAYSIGYQRQFAPRDKTGTPRPPSHGDRDWVIEQVSHYVSLYQDAAGL